MPNYLDDFRQGTIFKLGSKTVTENEIIRFAAEFDPQPFHRDPLAARSSAFGGLVASGWQTCGIFMRLLVDSVYKDTANLAGLGVDDMRWLVPVRPGDTLHGRATVLQARISRSNPNRGVLKLLFELTNQRGERVWHATSSSLLMRDPAAESLSANQ